jgi:hypothetical protein
MLTMYHPKTDGLSGHSNKMVVQYLHFHVEQNRTGWAQALPKVRFNIMNTVNMSTVFLLFMLKTRRAPRSILLIIPVELFVDQHEEVIEGSQARAFVKSIEE